MKSIAAAFGFALRLLALFVATAPATIAHGQKRGESVSLTVAGVSDYRLNGVSSSDNRPALQGIVHWQAPYDSFAGAFVSTVDFKDANHTGAELDVYFGRYLLREPVELVVEASFASFDDDEPGPTYDFWQLRSRVGCDAGIISMGATVAVSPEGAYGAGTAKHVRGDASLPISNWLRASATIGRGMFENRLDRTYRDAGVTFRNGGGALDLRYVDTSLGRAQCGYVGWCEATVVVTLAWRKVILLR